MLTRLTLPLLTMTTLLGLSACKTGATPEPDPSLTDEAGDQAALNAPSLLVEGLTVVEFLEVMRTAGCDDPKADSTQCAVCPDSEPVDIEVYPGNFTAPGRRGAVVASPACTTEADNVPTTRLLLVESNPKGGWVGEGTGDVTHLKQCNVGADASGLSHMTCVAQIERYGTTSTYHAHIGWPGNKAAPVQTTLVEVSERENCELNYSVSHSFTGPTVGAADDGNPQIVLTVDTSLGPFTKDLAECPEDNFAGPLTPERAPKTMTNTFTFTLTPEGPRERDGKSTYISLGAEYEDLMEQ